MTVKTSCCASLAWASPASTQSARPGTGSGVKSPSSNAGAVRGASELAIGLRGSDMACLLHAWNGTRARPRMAPLEDKGQSGGRRRRVLDPGVLGEPLVFGTAEPAIGLGEEHGRASEVRGVTLV